MDSAPAAPAVRRIKAPRGEDSQPPADATRLLSVAAFTAMTEGSPDAPNPSHSPSPGRAWECCALFPEAGTSPPSSQVTPGSRQRPRPGAAFRGTVCRCPGCSDPVPVRRPRRGRVADARLGGPGGVGWPRRVGRGRACRVVPTPSGGHGHGVVECSRPRRPAQPLAGDPVHVGWSRALAGGPVAVGRSLPRSGGPVPVGWSRPWPRRVVPLPWLAQPLAGDPVPGG